MGGKIKCALECNMTPFLESCCHATSGLGKFGYGRDWGTSERELNGMSVIGIWNGSSWGVQCGLCRGNQY